MLILLLYACKSTCLWLVFILQTRIVLHAFLSIFFHLAIQHENPLSVFNVSMVFYDTDTHQFMQSFPCWWEFTLFIVYRHLFVLVLLIPKSEVVGSKDTNILNFGWYLQNAFQERLWQFRFIPAKFESVLFIPIPSGKCTCQFGER